MEDLTRGLIEFILKNIPLQAELATVKGVSKDKLECTVELGEIKIEGVNLTPTEKLTGLIQIPKVGSHVVLSTLHNEEGDYFVSMFGEIEEVALITQSKERIKVTGDSIVLNEGKNGGLVRIEELRTQLEKNTAILKALLSVLTGAPVSEPGNGAPSALQTSLKAQLAGKQVGSFKKNIENDKILY